MSRRREPTDFIDAFADLRRCVSALGLAAYAKIEMGSTQAKFVRQIGKRSRVSQADLARATDSDPGLTGRITQALIDRGLVKRERSEEDRREYILELTAAGKRAQQRVEKLRAELAAEVVAVLDDADLDAFERIRKKILDRFQPPDGALP